MKNKNNIYTTIDLDEVNSTILNALNAQIAILSTQGEVVAFNERWNSCRDQLNNPWSHPGLKMNFLKSLQPPLTEGDDFALRLLLGIKEVLNGEKESFETVIMQNIGGTSFWFKISVNALGAEKGAVLIYEDISTQKKHKNYLRESQYKFEKHFQNSLYGIFITDENHQIKEINNEACNILGINKEHITETKLSNFLPVDFDLGTLQRKINRIGNFLGEYELKTAEGKIIPIELSANILRNEQQKPVVSWAFKDITDKRKTEKALDATERLYEFHFNNTLEGTIIGCPDGHIIAANPAACNILGYTAEELEGEHRDIVFDSSLTQNAKALSKRHDKGEFSGEVIFTHKDGHQIPTLVSSVIFVSEDGSEKTIVNIKDISSQKAIQKELTEEKEFNELAISSLPTAFFVFTRDGKLIRWNNVLENELGYSHDEIAHMNVLELVHPEDQSLLTDILNGPLVGKKVTVEARCLSKNGDPIHYLIRGTSFKQNDEIFIVGGGLNRNDIKAAEQEKKRNSELLNQLFYNSPIGIVLVNADGTVQNANQSFENIFGFTSEEITDKNLDQTIVPNYMDEQAKTLSRMSFTGDTFQTEAIRVHKDGREIPVLIGGVPVEVEGEVIAIYGMYVDITERKQLEDQIVGLLETEKTARIHMEEMFEEAPSAIALLEGEDHTYTYVNEQYKQLVGRKNIVGKDMTLVLPEFSDQGFIDLLDTCYQTGEYFHFNEREVYFNSSNQGSESHFLNFVFKPMRNDLDEIYGILIEAIDVTEQVQARNIIEHSLKEKDTLLAEVHHRVKNNLAIISGLLELELMDTDDVLLSKHLNSTQTRIRSIAKIHELLYQSESLTHVNFKHYIESILKSDNSKSLDTISTFNLEDVELNVNQAIPAGVLLNEVISCIQDIHKDNFDTKDCNIRFNLNEDSNGTVTITLQEKDINLFEHFQKAENNSSELRMELIDILLRQIHGKMDIAPDNNGSITISFTKREAKGPHSALKN